MTFFDHRGWSKTSSRGKPFHERRPPRHVAASQRGIRGGLNFQRAMCSQRAGQPQALPRQGLNRQQWVSGDARGPDRPANAAKSSKQTTVMLRCLAALRHFTASKLIRRHRRPSLAIDYGLCFLGPPRLAPLRLLQLRGHSSSKLWGILEGAAEV